MNTDPIDDLGPPLAIGCIMIAVGLALPILAVVWMCRLVLLWAMAKVKKEPRERG